MFVRFSSPLMLRLIVIAKRRDVQERFPIPLINRLEKHFLALSTVLSPQQASMARDLQNWVKQFSEVHTSSSRRGGKKFTEGDAFTGYHQDTTAALILHACEDHPLPGTRGVGGGHTRSEGSRQWQDVVLQRAKFLLMMMCPPDAVARLPHTELEVQSKDCWEIYFEIQRHESLVGYLCRALDVQHNLLHLSLQVTTHARLLSTVDAEQIMEELKLPAGSLHCLLLQQFHTEQQFCREVSEFFHRDLPGQSRVLIVQCDEGDQHSDLLACARHRLHEERQNAEKSAKEACQDLSFHVIFIIQLPRKAGGCFEGAQGGLWRSVHIDELRPSTSVDTPNVTSLVGRSVSDLFRKSVKTQFGRESSFEEAMDVDEGPADQSMDTSELPEQFEAMDVSTADNTSGTHSVLSLSQLLANSVQEAVSRLDDIHGPFEKVEPRIRNRIFIFQSLLKDEAGPVGKQFLAALSGHILTVLQERDELAGESATKWVQNEALTTSSLQAGGTFQRALWLKLQSIICPILSEVIAVFDCSCNLDLLQETCPLWLRQLWLGLFTDPEVISLNYQKMLVEDSSQMRDRVPVLACGTQNHTFSCQLPFSWCVKAIVDSFLPQATSTSTHSGQPVVVCLRDALLSTNAGKLLRDTFESNKEAVLFYLQDFIRMTHHTDRQDARDILAIALFTAQREIQLTDQLPHVFDLASIHVAHLQVQGRLHCMLRLLGAVQSEVLRRAVSVINDGTPEMVCV